MRLESLELIVPHVECIRDWLTSDDVSEIMVNSNGTAYFERDGEMHRIPNVDFLEPERQQDLAYACQKLGRLRGKEVDEFTPILNTRLSDDGSRVSIVFPPVAFPGIQLSIRKFQSRYFDIEHLITVGMITRETADILQSALINEENVMVSGKTGAGKTTLLNALVNRLPGDTRFGVLEDEAEIQIAPQNAFRFLTRIGQQGFSEVTARDILKAAMRFLPQRIIVGEVRGAEAWDMLQALNSGHSGSVCTIHANNAMQSLYKLTGYVKQAIDIDRQFIQEQIADLIRYVVHIDKPMGGRRHVSEVLRIDGFDRKEGCWLTETAYKS